MSEKVITPVARLAYPALFEPTAMDDTQKKKYQATLIFPLDADLGPLKAAVLACAKAKYGDKAAEMFKKGQLRSPFRDQKDKEGKQGFSEGFYISARSDQRPGVVDADLQPILDPGEVYGGLLVRASVKTFCYDRSGNKGVSFALQNVMIVKDDGTRWDGRANPEDEFAEFRRQGAAAGAKVESTQDIF